MRELNVNEVEQVNGGVGPAGAGFGAFVGAAGYLGSAAASGNFNFGNFANATLGGAAIGFAGGPIGSAAGRYLVPRLSFLTGFGSSVK